jgi:hypothetical protein
VPSHPPHVPGRPSLELIDEATLLLRRAPRSLLLAYYVGSAPCILGILYFIAEMSRGPFARAHLAEASFGMGALFIWMKCWHAVFARGLRATLALEPPIRWTSGRVLRLIVTQGALQPVGLFARILSAQILVPYVWVYGFFQSAGVIGDGTLPVREVIRESWAQARLWPRQAHYALLFLFGFALLVWLNVGVLTILMPQLLNMFFGIETIFTQSPGSLMNSTLVVATLGLTYLCFDPLRKAVFVVRCFRGSALQSGEDLKVQLRTLQAPLRRAALAAVLLLNVAAPLTAHSQESSSPAAPRVDAAELNRSIEEVLQRREFAWRAPREKLPDSEKGWLTLFMEDAAKAIGRTMKKGFEIAGDFIEWLAKLFKGKERSSDKSENGSWSLANSAREILYGVIAVCVLVLAVVLWRMRHQFRAAPVTAEAIAPMPDLSSRNVVADQLPEDGWLQLARQLMESGELRLACVRRTSLASRISGSGSSSPSRATSRTANTIGSCVAALVPARSSSPPLRKISASLSRRGMGCTT